MKDMPAGKNMGAALGTAPAASSSFGSDPFSMNSEDLRDWLKTKLIDKKHHKCADTLCDQQLAGKGFKEVTKDDLTKDYNIDRPRCQGHKTFFFHAEECFFLFGTHGSGYDIAVPCKRAAEHCIVSIEVEPRTL